MGNESSTHSSNDVNPLSMKRCSSVNVIKKEKSINVLNTNLVRTVSSGHLQKSDVNHTNQIIDYNTTESSTASSPVSESSDINKNNINNNILPEINKSEKQNKMDTSLPSFSQINKECNLNDSNINHLNNNNKNTNININESNQVPINHVNEINQLNSIESTKQSQETNDYQLDNENDNINDNDNDNDKDEDNNIESLDLQCIEWEGYVQKKGHLLRNWKTRFFTLEGNVLSYYESKEDARHRKHLKGRVTIKEVKLDNRVKTAHGNDFVFETKEDKHFHISAYTALDRKVWIHMIEAGIDSDAMKNRNEKIYGNHNFRRTTRPTTSQVYGIYKRILSDEPELISEFLFYFNRDLVVSAYYPRNMPFHGDFFGREGLLYIVSAIRESAELLDFKISTVTTDTDGKCITIKGSENFKSKLNHSEIEQPFVHHIRLGPYGSIIGLKIDIDPRYAKGNWSAFGVSNPYGETLTNGVRSTRSLSISLQDFTVFHVIGKGGFGTVVNAMKKSDGQIYALKILEKGKMTKYDIESSFTEMRVAQNIHHPFIAGLRIAFQSQTKLFLGMNYYSGGDLFHHMSKGATSRIAPARARFYTAELILGIHHLHQHDILYRDIKPENVMIDADGHIALVDFGLAKLHVSNYQGANTMAGSPQYTAPELLLPKGKRSYGKAADWWSLGILLFEMSIGKSPFFDNNIEKMYHKIQNDPLMFPPRPALNEDLKDILLGLLMKNPQERYGNKISDLLEHKYFEGIDWDLLLQKKIEAPWKPKLTSALDVGYVDSEFTELNAKEEVGSPQKSRSMSFLSNSFIEKIGIAKIKEKKHSTMEQDPAFKDFTYFCEDPNALVEVETLVDELHLPVVDAIIEENINHPDIDLSSSLPPPPPSGTPLAAFVENGKLDYPISPQIPSNAKADLTDTKEPISSESVGSNMDYPSKIITDNGDTNKLDSNVPSIDNSHSITNTTNSANYNGCNELISTILENEYEEKSTSDSFICSQ